MVLKHRIWIVLGALLALAAGSLAGAENVDYVRLHVVAADDGQAAQALKLRVRDAVLQRARALLDQAEDAEDAWAIVRRNREVLEEAARACARENGYEGAVVCQTGVFPFPDRVYGGALVPAGDYRALRVVLGEGQGHNWWCVLYPDLCYPEGVDPAHPRLRFALLDWLFGLFGGEAA